MAKNNLQESEQQGQGITIGTQGNSDMGIPGPGAKGSHHSKETHDDKHIPNQERSSAGNQERGEGNRE